MLKKTILSFVAIVASLCVYNAIYVENFAVERAVTIDANTALIFPFVNNVQKAEDWNPFSKGDPNIKRTFGDKVEGVDASMSWNGNADVGEGTVTIIESVLNQKVRVRLDFVRPFAGRNFGEYTLMPIGYQTVVKWKISGTPSFFPRLLCLFVSMDRLLGGKLDSGLMNLKKIAEAQPKF